MFYYYYLFEFLFFSAKADAMHSEFLEAILQSGLFVQCLVLIRDGLLGLRALFVVY